MDNDLKPRIVVFGVGGGGSNAVDNMIRAELKGVDFIAANTDAQALSRSLAENRVQLGLGTTRGLGAGARPEVGAAAAEESVEEISRLLEGANMVFVAAGMGGGTGTGSAPVIARLARERGILTVGVVTKPFQFEGPRRMSAAESGLQEMRKNVDTLIVIPNQNIFRIANEKTTMTESFSIADKVLYSGVRGITDLMTIPGIVNLDFADVRTIMAEMGAAMMGTGEATGDKRALHAAQAAISNPLLDDISMKGAKAVLINITGGDDITLYEVDEATNEISSLVDPNANIIWGTAIDPSMTGTIRVSVVATGIDIQAEAMKVNTNRSMPRTDRPAEPTNAVWLSGTRPAQTPGPAQQSNEAARTLEPQRYAARAEERPHDANRTETPRPEVARPDVHRPAISRPSQTPAAGGEDLYSQLLSRANWDATAAGGRPASEAPRNAAPGPRFSAGMTPEADPDPYADDVSDVSPAGIATSGIASGSSEPSPHKKVSIFAWRNATREAPLEPSASGISQPEPTSGVAAPPQGAPGEDEADLVIPAFLRRAR